MVVEQREVLAVGVAVADDVVDRDGPEERQDVGRRRAADGTKRRDDAGDRRPTLVFVLSLGKHAERLTEIFLVQAHDAHVIGQRTVESFDHEARGASDVDRLERRCAQP